MGTIDHRQCIELILERVPGFRGSWNRHKKQWGDRNVELGMHIVAFSWYVADLIESHHQSDLADVFTVVEELLANGNPEVQAALTTCFLENLMNRIDSELFPASAFVPSLGPRSREFCKTWDQYTGLKTEGLW